MKSRLMLLFVILLSAAEVGQCERIKDIVDIQGIRGNPLTGFGLIIGLAGTGDSTPPSQRMLTNLLRDSGLVFSPSDLTGGNIAIVMVTAMGKPSGMAETAVATAVINISDAFAPNIMPVPNTRAENPMTTNPINLANLSSLS